VLGTAARSVSGIVDYARGFNLELHPHLSPDSITHARRPQGLKFCEGSCLLLPTP
jgi:hypothetical protein